MFWPELSLFRGHKNTGCDARNVSETWAWGRETSEAWAGETDKWGTSIYTRHRGDKWDTKIHVRHRKKDMWGTIPNYTSVATCASLIRWPRNASLVRRSASRRLSENTVFDHPEFFNEPQILLEWSLHVFRSIEHNIYCKRTLYWYPVTSLIVAPVTVKTYEYCCN